MDGIAAAGWKLVYTDKPSDYQKTSEAEAKSIDYSTSIGITVSTKDSKISDVRWNGPAFNAGVTTSTTLVAVNGREFSAERLKEAVAATSKGTPIELLIKNGEIYKTYRLVYSDGLRYPHLERMPGATDRLSAILAARK
jgi:predicted metalloprotease with PDZ domain